MANNVQNISTVYNALRYPNMTEAYNLKNRPSIVPEQWRILIKYWKSSKAEACSEGNKKSRAKFKSIHTTGTKTHAEIREEEAMKNPDGREPSRVEMYITTHKPKNGNPVNDDTKRIVRKSIKRFLEALQCGCWLMSFAPRPFWILRTVLSLHM